ncbi:lytic transglycosylase domain-containing protein [Palleronia sp. THAF1]|uniref:lytic transglycosylase domain-containing protein n=1 Tax=Palleronia sp. THAF1 TaxID=2587842 RepID=UPI002A4E167C|nr:lytic transglycosylase domain-containing protein [Palleronia sp. THAF1]
MPAIAEPPPFRDFTFKRVGVPKKGQVNRLVQIDPAEQARILAVPKRAPSVAPEGEAFAALPDAAPKSAKYDWFWKKVPRNGIGPGGLESAMAVLGAPPAGVGGGGYRLETLKKIADAHGATILGATIGTQVSPALALAVIAVESAGRPTAVSHAGAQGLMQLMPATAERFGVKDSNDPRQNISGGVKYLHWLMDRFKGDPLLVLAGYNAGEGAVDKHKGVPPYAETMDYVPKVLAAFNVARGLCATRPMLISDGCVFVGDRMAQAN